MKSKGFTLIELLIVVAIIGILAAIAIPNFLQAQVRAKAAKAKAELATLATALETYHIDHNQYPFDGGNCTNSLDRPYWYVPWDITTPIEYITNNNLVDPFRESYYASGAWLYERYRYQNVDDTWGRKYGICAGGAPSTYYDNMICLVGHWCLHSLGPNRYYGPTAPGMPNDCGYPAHPMVYDPTNGTVSDGNIMRSQKESDLGQQ